MAVTLKAARDMLAAYLRAECEILEAKSTTFNGRTLTMVDLSEIQNGRKDWERRVARLEQAAAGRGSGYKLAQFQ